MEAIAITAATLATKWAAESFVKEAAKSGFGSLKPIYEWVRSKLSHDPIAEVTLAEASRNANDEASISELAGMIGARLEADPSLKPELERLIGAAKEAPETRSMVVNVLDNARVGKFVHIVTVHGNVSF